MAYRHPATLSAVSAEELINRLEQVRFGAIQGDHGTGKSTLLHGLASGLDQRFPGGRWVQLNRDPALQYWGRAVERISNAVVTRRTQVSAADGGVLVIDGAEQLPPGILTYLRIHAGSRGPFCLITTHKPQRGFVCLHRTSLNRRLIESMFDELIRSLPDLVFREKIEKHFRTLDLEKFRNVRDLWSSLYDWVERHQFGNECVGSSGDSDSLLRPLRLSQNSNPSRVRGTSGPGENSID